MVIILLFIARIVKLSAVVEATTPKGFLIGTARDDNGVAGGELKDATHRYQPAYATAPTATIPIKALRITLFITFTVYPRSQGVSATPVEKQETPAYIS